MSPWLANPLTHLSNWYSRPPTEQQEHGSMLCAQHALNALLQGNYYDPSQLA